MKIQTIHKKEKICTEKMDKIVHAIHEDLIISYHSHYHDYPRFSIFFYSGNEQKIILDSGVIFMIDEECLKYFDEIITKFKKAKLI